MLHRLKNWVGASLPTLIPIFAFLVGMRAGFWIMNSLVVFAIAYYAYRKRQTEPRWIENPQQTEEIKKWQWQFTLLLFVACFMIWRGLQDASVVKDSERLCRSMVSGDRGDYEDRDRCEGILNKIKGNPNIYD